MIDVDVSADAVDAVTEASAMSLILVTRLMADCSWVWVDFLIMTAALRSLSVNLDENVDSV
jgi:hypothetical protein